MKKLRWREREGFTEDFEPKEECCAKVYIHKQMVKNLVAQPFVIGQEPDRRLDCFLSCLFEDINLHDDFLIIVDRIIRYCWRHLRISYENTHMRLLRLAQGTLHRDVECFVFCVFKTGELVDYRGKVVLKNIDSFAANIRKYLPAAGTFDWIRSFTYNCTMKVNAAQFEAVFEKYVDVQCERAALMFKCMAKIEKKYSLLKKAVQVLLASSFVRKERKDRNIWDDVN